MDAAIAIASGQVQRRSRRLPDRRVGSSPSWLRRRSRPLRWHRGHTLPHRGGGHRVPGGGLARADDRRASRLTRAAASPRTPTTAPRGSHSARADLQGSRFAPAILAYYGRAHQAARRRRARLRPRRRGDPRESRARSRCRSHDFAGRSHARARPPARRIPADGDALGGVGRRLGGARSLRRGRRRPAAASRSAPRRRRALADLVPPRAARRPGGRRRRPCSRRAVAAEATPATTRHHRDVPR